MSEHTTQTCVGCGQSDDHPKVHHLGAWIDRTGTLQTDDSAATFHHDCYPFQVNGEHAQKVVEKAKSGTHGDALRAYIQKTAPKGA